MRNKKGQYINTQYTKEEIEGLTNTLKGYLETEEPSEAIRKTWMKFEHINIFRILGIYQKLRRA